MIDNQQSAITSVDGSSVVFQLTDQLLSSLLKMVTTDSPKNSLNGTTHNSYDHYFKYYKAVVGSSVRFVLVGLLPLVKPINLIHVFGLNTSIEMIIAGKDDDNITLENLVLNVRIDLEPSEFQKYVIGSDDLSPSRHFSNQSLQSIAREGGDLYNQIFEIFNISSKNSQCDFNDQFVPTSFPTSIDNLSNFYPVLSVTNFVDNIDTARYNGLDNKSVNNTTLNLSDVDAFNHHVVTDKDPFIIVSRDFTTVESMGSLVNDLERFFRQAALDTARKTSLMMTVTKATTCRLSLCYAKPCHPRRDTKNLAALRFDTQTIVEVRQSARKKKKTERTGDFQTQSEPFSGSREPHIPLNYEQIVWRIRTRQYTKIVFVVGAGASVAAGIPDFRSLISGLYAQVADAELKVQKPDDVFKLSHFKVCPSDFYIVARKFFLGSSAVPSQAQHFMKHCADFGLLLDVFTQNIDGLELDAGLSLEQVTQVHGHMRTASCVDCKSPHDASSFFKNLATDTLMYCDEQSCGGLVKPDIIFFDEGILSDTIQRLSAISASDLVIVMGTSLKVNPMSYTMEHLPKTIPVLVMDIKLPEVLNRRKTNNLVFVEGQIERSVQCISEDFRWSQSALKNRIDSNTFTTVFTQTNNNTTSVATSSGSCIEDVVGDKTVSFYNFRNIIDESNLVNMTLDWPSVRSLFCLQVRNMAPFPVVFDNTSTKHNAVPFNRANLKGGDDSVWYDLLFFDGVLSFMKDDSNTYTKKSYNQHIHIKEVILSLLFAHDSNRIFTAHQCNIVITHSCRNNAATGIWRCLSAMCEYFRMKPFTVPDRYASIRDELMNCMKSKYFSLQCMIERCVVNCVRESVFRKCCDCRREQVKVALT